MGLRVDYTKKRTRRVVLIVIVAVFFGALGLLMLNEKRLDANRPEREPLVYVKIEFVRLE